MKSIRARLALAFLCIIVLLIIQGVVAYHNVQAISRIESEAYEHRLQIKDLESRLANLRLLVFKILGTLNPSQMDDLRRQFQQERRYLQDALPREGIAPDAIAENFNTYARIIDLHYNFSVRTAQKLINTESKTYHERLVSRLRTLSEKVQKNTEASITSAYQQARRFTFGLLLTGVLIAIAWALLLARSLIDRQQAENALRSSHERFLTVLDSIDATIYVADMNTHEILFMNRHMIDSFGRDMTGGICYEGFRDRQDPCPHCTNDQLLDRDGNPTGVCVWQAHNPVTDKWYINYDRAIEWIDGRMVRLQIATDITDLKDMEEELRQAHKMEAIGTLAGGIAHEFNNILGIIIGNVELAIEDVPSANPAQQSLAEIMTAGLRAKEIVHQLLRFSRKTEEALKPVAITPVITDAIQFLRSTLPSSITIDKEIRTTDEVVAADPTQLHQVMMNLCVNALHAMEDTGGTLTISVAVVDLDSRHTGHGSELPAGAYVRIRVGDTGQGIEPDILDRIFDPFFTTKAFGKGSGMGLSVVHGIVQNHNGAISVESEPGDGTTFTILLPVIAGQAEEIREAGESIPRGSEHILFVDDEKSIADMAGEMLKRLGYRIEVFSEPEAALERFQEAPSSFDLVITDMTMPRMTGVQLTDAIRDIRVDVPVIICTGHSSHIDDDKAHDLGIDAFVMKPIVKDQLANIIRDVLDDRNPG